MIGFSDASATSPPLEVLGFHMGKPAQLLLMLFSISTVCLQSPVKPTTTLAKVLGEGGGDATALSGMAGQMLDCASRPWRKYGDNPLEG